ncbi:MAG: hypothetical protein ABIQ90_09965, partial [Polaromonas sp.]
MLRELGFISNWLLAQWIRAGVAIYLVALVALLGVAGRESPGGDSLSFASPKESKQRKGDPTVCVP